ncbi:MAG: L-rhamnose isomerase [Candidatus Aminicenantes bacterium RBG_16_63_16]|nr:MAG: L-rhamnose isomerase [Candidatus Aminicenantes bacterium RBG_16_63_16]
MSILDTFETSKIIGYETARARYGEMGIDAEAAMTRLSKIPVSLHCWQGDDVGGFESAGEATGGGIMATGAYPGKARTPGELRSDLEKVYSLVPGKHRLSLHASYLESGGRKVDRDGVGPEHFAGWVAWAKEQGIGLDFNQTFFAHPKAASNFTLAHNDDGIRRFWVDHAIAGRRIGEYIGRQLGSPCVTNLWIPDGFKDAPVDRKASRALLKDSLDRIFSVKLDKRHILDSVEPKLFGIGVESCTIGSFEFYLGYAVRNNLLICLDMGHYHPTESVADKISSVLFFLDEVLLHVSRPVRWDSDHVVILSDDLQDLAREIVRGEFLDRVHIGLDFFDASINRIAAWVIGTRSMLKALLAALLEPVSRLKKLEAGGDFTARLAILEELKTLPFGGVWDEYCRRQDVPIGLGWLGEVKKYERSVLTLRK